ncbi:MAG: PIG-L family deacetylase [Acidobacteria bacterium]|nr:PIG-L family deacetylase [Acidobacteriota bacterium]
MILSTVIVLFTTLQAQTPPAGELESQIRRLATTGSVLMIAAHPDDENTNLLAYFARGRNLRTGYLSLTRGEGGQNLIGPEQGDYMGLIRTQELLAARRIDGAQQYFTRAIDFGFSKNADETLSKWGREQVLGDIVWVIRNFRPDVIILRFSGTPRDGHGHHQSSAILGKEAFAAAADPKRFPEQLAQVKPWQARRILFNLFSFTREMEKENESIPNKITVDSGAYNPLFGMSYGELAGRSRSQHASQGMGVPQRRGAIRDQLTVIAGDPATKDPFEGIDVSWSRYPNGAAIGALLQQAAGQFRGSHPEASLPALTKARTLLAALDHPDAKRKLTDIDEVIAQCAGLWIDASADRPLATPGSKVALNLNIVRRSRTDAILVDAQITGLYNAPVPNAQSKPLAFNEPLALKTEWNVPADAAPSQPFWLAKPKNGTLYNVTELNKIGLPEDQPILEARVRFVINGVECSVSRPMLHRYVDHVRGELTRAFLIGPPVAAEFTDPILIFPTAQPRLVHVSLKANQPNASGQVRLQAPQGWKVEPASRDFRMQQNGEQSIVTFTVTPPSANSSASLRAIVQTSARDFAQSMKVISYPHIPPQTVFPLAEAKLIRSDIRITSKRIGYVMGAGDDIPEALRQLGVDVTPLSDEDLASVTLARFDAIVTGVRAFNTRTALRANMQRLLDYTASGGTFVVQYNVLESFAGRDNRDTLSRLGPYPIQLGRDRVTVEEAPMQFPDRSHPALTTPNKITDADFEGWVQERGLYFAKEFDPKYQSLFSSHDPKEDWLPGGMLYARYGKGVYVHTSYSWFRQLPAGVPGAYRIFANLLSAK